MPVISNEDFAAFQAWKAQGGAAAPQVPAQQPPTPTVTPPAPPKLPVWDPQKGYVGGPAGPPDASGINRDGLPPPRDIGGGQFDYTEQSAEIQRRFEAAKRDPSSPLYVSPEKQAMFDKANSMQAASNPGWTYHKEGNYWTPDDAHNNAAGQASFGQSWAALGRDNPRAFGLEGQGLYGEGSPNFVQDPTTGAWHAKTPDQVSPQGPQNGAAYGGADPSAPPRGWERGPDGQLRPQVTQSTPAEPTGVVGGGHRPIVRAPTPAPSAAGIGREGAPRPAAPPVETGVVGGGHRPIVRPPAPPTVQMNGADPASLAGEFAPPAATAPPPPRPTMPGAFRPPAVRYRGGF